METTRKTSEEGSGKKCGENSIWNKVREELDRMGGGKSAEKRVIVTEQEKNFRDKKGRLEEDQGKE